MNVLEKDRQLAEKIMEFGALCLHQARLEFIDEQFDEAERLAKEFIRCKRDLDELVRKKEEHDELVRLVETMKERGIDVMLVMRKENE